MEKLLTRENFSKLVFKRDNHTCVFCQKPAVDAHHILDRKLWKDGGYYLSNGASVCEEHHWECEKTTISVNEVRLAAEIKQWTIPENLSKEKTYDKWGNIELDNGFKIPGPLFNDDGVQKIFKKQGMLYLFQQIQA